MPIPKRSASPRATSTLQSWIVARWPRCLTSSNHRQLPPEGRDQAASAPSVIVINLSICDSFRPFARVMSPLGRLLDYLSHRYRVLFLISAGNITDRLPPFQMSIEFEGATAEEDRLRACTPVKVLLRNGPIKNIGRVLPLADDAFPGRACRRGVNRMPGQLLRRMLASVCKSFGQRELVVRRVAAALHHHALVCSHVRQHVDRASAPVRSPPAIG